MLVGQVSGGKVSGPGTSEWKVSKAKKLKSPAGQSDDQAAAAALGRPIRVISAMAPLSKRPSMAASAAG